MGYEIKWTLLARSDLRKIVEHIARDNPSAAEKFGQDAFQEIEHLSDLPMSGNDIPEKTRDDYRQIIYRRTYRIVYRIRETEKRVEVLRVWHGARRLPKL